MTESPKISIIIPSYNQGQYIEQTILSVIEQDYANVEVIIIDGGSTDNTVDIIKKYESQVSYWVSENDNGQAHAINKGFEKATGDIFGWINSDDYYLPGYLKLVAKTFSRHKQVQIVYCNSITLDERDGRTYDEYGHFIIEPFLVFGSIVQSHTTFWRKDIHKPLDEKINCAIDYELWLRLFPGRSWKHINFFGAVFRVQVESKSMGAQDSTKQKWDDDFKYIRQKHNLSEPGIWKKRAFQYIDAAYRRYCQFSLIRGNTNSIISKGQTSGNWKTIKEI